MSTDLSWLKNLKPSVIKFLSYLKTKKLGFYHYSLSGDLFDENIHWGLGNAVFAAKIYYMLKKLDKKRALALSSFIKNFEHKRGYIFDPLIYQLAPSQEIKRAETRQAFAALAFLGQKPNKPFLDIPHTKSEVQKYLENLDWSQPWGAASHFSHLLFFWEYNKRFFNYKSKLVKTLKKFALDWISFLQSPIDGSWYQENPSGIEKINGAMKILTGFVAANIHFCPYADKLIDLCLENVNNRQACDNLNIVYVLYLCSKRSNHRFDEIKNFCLKRLDVYRQYFFPKFGGFSFYKNQASNVYYGAEITKGLNEPDIHGTVMFLWGITLISEILGLGLEFKIPSKQ